MLYFFYIIFLYIKITPHNIRLKEFYWSSYYFINYKFLLNQWLIIMHKNDWKFLLTYLPLNFK